MKKIILAVCVLFIGVSFVFIATELTKAPEKAVSYAIPSEMAKQETNRGLLLINQKEYQQAIAILQSDSLKEDANAQFWLAVALYKSGEHFSAGEFFLQAAEMGDPWAMSIMGGGDESLYSNSPCGYLGWGCDDKWHDKALTRWKELAEQGDPDALYAVTVIEHEWWHYIDSYRYQHLLALYEQAIPNGGGYAFFDRYRLKAKDSVKYLTMAANRGYAPAMVDLYKTGLLSEEEASKWIHKALSLGYVGAAANLYFKYWRDGKGNGESKEEHKQAYYYSYLSSELGYSIGAFNLLRTPVYDESGNITYEVHVTTSEQAEIERNANALLNNIKKNDFLIKSSDSIFSLN